MEAQLDLKLNQNARFVTLVVIVQKLVQNHRLENVTLAFIV